MAGYERFVRSAATPGEEVEIAQVDELASELRTYLAEVAPKIDEAHVHGADSSTIQGIVSELLCGRLNFQEEVPLTSEPGLVTSARPDFFFPLRGGRGILVEVERGGTIANNHDLKDLWKTHVAGDAQHLFLVVPMANGSIRSLL